MKLKEVFHLAHSLDDIGARCPNTPNDPAHLITQKYFPHAGDLDFYDDMIPDAGEAFETFEDAIGEMSEALLTIVGYDNNPDNVVQRANGWMIAAAHRNDDGTFKFVEYKPEKVYDNLTMSETKKLFVDNEKKITKVTDYFGYDVLA